MHGPQALQKALSEATRLVVVMTVLTLQPVHVPPAFRQRATAPSIFTNWSDMPERSNHQTPLSIALIVRWYWHAIGFGCTAVAGEREDGGLPEEVHCRGILVQIGEHGSERLARMQFLRRRRILGIHVHHEVGVRGKKGHLTFRIATIGAVRIGLNEFADGRDDPPILRVR